MGVEDQSDGCGGKFAALIVSKQFEGKKLLERHRLVSEVPLDLISRIFKAKFAMNRPPKNGNSKFCIVFSISSEITEIRKKIKEQG